MGRETEGREGRRRRERGGQVTQARTRVRAHVHTRTHLHHLPKQPIPAQAAQTS